MARHTGLTGQGAKNSPPEHSSVRRWRKVTGRAIQWLGFLLGAAFALTYGALLWTDPAPDLSHARPRGIVGVYVIMPILLFGGTVWLFNWIAGRLDPDIARDL